MRTDNRDPVSGVREPAVAVQVRIFGPEYLPRTIQVGFGDTPALVPDDTLQVGVTVLRQPVVAAVLGYQVADSIPMNGDEIGGVVSVSILIRQGGVKGVDLHFLVDCLPDFAIRGGGV